MRRRRRQQFDRVQFLSFYFRAGNIIAGEHRKIQSFIWFPFLCAPFRIPLFDYFILSSYVVWCGSIAWIFFSTCGIYLINFFFAQWASLETQRAGGGQPTKRHRNQASAAMEKISGLLRQRYIHLTHHTPTLICRSHCTNTYTHTHIQLNLTVSFNKDVVVVVVVPRVRPVAQCENSLKCWLSIYNYILNLRLFVMFFF